MIQASRYRALEWTGMFLAVGLSALVISFNLAAPLSTYDGGISAAAATFTLHGLLPYRDYWLLYGPLSGFLLAIPTAFLGPSIALSVSAVVMLRQGTAGLPPGRTAGLELAQMDQSASLWQGGAGSRGVTSSTFYARFQRYLRDAGLAPSGVHITRHTAAKLRRDAGESIEAVSAFLDHSSLAVTTVYLRRLEGETDRAWVDVAAAIWV